MPLKSALWSFVCYSRRNMWWWQMLQVFILPCKMIGPRITFNAIIGRKLDIVIGYQLLSIELPGRGLLQKICLQTLNWRVSSTILPGTISISLQNQMMKIIIPPSISIQKTQMLMAANFSSYHFDTSMFHFQSTELLQTLTKSPMD